MYSHQLGEWIKLRITSEKGEGKEKKKNVYVIEQIITLIGPKLHLYYYVILVIWIICIIQNYDFSQRARIFLR